MAMDRAGWRATKVAQVAVTAAMSLVILGAAFVLWLIAVTLIYHRSMPQPETLLFALAFPLLLGLASLRAFLSDVLAGHVFTPRNSARLYRIAWLMIGAAAVKVLLVAITTRAVVVLVLGLAQPMLLAGLLVLVLASAWRYGSELQNERDLTV